MTAAEVNIREAVKRDYRPVWQLTRMMGYEVQVAELESRLEEILTDTSQQVFVAEDSVGQVQGFAHVFSAVRLGVEAFSEIGGLAVAEHCRKRGVGKKLVARCERWTLERGKGSLRVRCDARRTDAAGFYQALDFGHLKDQKVFHKSVHPQEIKAL